MLANRVEVIIIKPKSKDTYKSDPNKKIYHFSTRIKDTRSDEFICEILAMEDVMSEIDTIVLPAASDAAVKQIRTFFNGTKFNIKEE